MYVVIGASLWGTIGLFTRSLAPFISPLQMAFARCLVTVIILLAALLVLDRKLLRISPRDIWMFIGTGLFSIVFFTVSYFTTQQLVSLSTASVLLYTAPCFVVIMSAVLFKEKLTRNKVLALALAFAGCVFATGIGMNDLNIGVLYGIMAGFGYALYSIFSKYALVKYKLLTILFYTFLVASVCLLPFCDLPQFADACSEQTVIFNILALGILCTIMPYYFYTVGLKGMDAGKASIIAFVEPMVATVLSICIGDPFGIMNIVGIMMIFCSLVLLNHRAEDQPTSS